jgi:ABC-type nitrate/sulfonate/bicarbonate transport system ATPase subunit
MLSVIGLEVVKDGKQIIEGINFNLNKNSFLSVVGKSGVGKTTLLDTIACFSKKEKGSIILDGNELETPSSNVAYLPQGYALYSWMTVYQNIFFSIEFREISDSAKHERTMNVIKQLELLDSIYKYPSQLSGGMKQRVALARALNPEPSLILLDEPFNALDYSTKQKAREFLVKIFRTNKCSVIMVTHDLSDAVALSDEIILLNGSPATISKMWTMENQSDFHSPQNVMDELLQEIEA